MFAGKLKAFFAYVCHKIIDYIMFKYQVSKRMSSDSSEMDYSPEQSECADGGRVFAGVKL